MGGNSTPALSGNFGGGGYNLGDFGAQLSAGGGGSSFTDVANTIATVAGGANNALNAALAIRNSLRTPKQQGSRISLGGSSLGGLPAGQQMNSSNLASGLKVQSTDLGNPAAALASGPRNPQGGISRAHYDTFLELMKAYRG